MGLSFQCWLFCSVEDSGSRKSSVGIAKRGVSRVCGFTLSSLHAQGGLNHGSFEKYTPMEGRDTDNNPYHASQ
jgi:hypothetical protein